MTKKHADDFYDEIRVLRVLATRVGLSGVTAGMVRRLTRLIVASSLTVEALHTRDIDEITARAERAEAAAPSQTATRFFFDLEARGLFVSRADAERALERVMLQRPFPRAVISECVVTSPDQPEIPAC